MGLNGFPLTRAAVMRAREQAGFVTPLEPIRPGEPWCVFEQRGTIEFMCHPFDAEDFLAAGIVIDGKRLDATKIDEYPMLGAIHILAVDPDQNKTFIPR